MTEFYLMKVKMVFNASGDDDFPFEVHSVRRNKCLGKFPDRRLAEAFILAAELIDSEQGEYLLSEINPEEE
jgi:hypothetical protein